MSSVRKPADSTNKAVKMPANFVKKEQWDSFRFQVENYCSVLDVSYLEELKTASKHTGPLSVEDFTDETQHRAIMLYAMLS